jgi:fumarate hydratase class II
LATAISPLVGHDKAAEVVKKATLRGKTIREVLTEDNLVPREKLDQALNLRRMTKGGRT